MIDINLIRNNFEDVKKNLEKRQDDQVIVLLNKVKSLDEEWRKKRIEIDKLRHERNELSKEIGIKKKNKENADELFKKAKEVGKKIEELEDNVTSLHEEVIKILKRIPNLLDESVPYGKDDNDNVEVRVYGDNKVIKEKSHVDILQENKLADFERASKASGARAYYLFDEMVLLDMALQHFALDFLKSKGFRIIYPPLMMKREIEEAATDLEAFQEMIYKIEGEDLYMIPTSEHAILGYYYNEILNENELPIKFAGISPCFRKEAGSHGKDTKGIFRVHQFNKIEQFIYCKPEESWEFLEELVHNTEEMLQMMKIPYHVVNVCTGDIGTVAAKKYDIEAWYPVQQAYREVASISNCTDYQSRRANIKYFKGSERKLVHTLNGTAIATSRIMVAIIENFQEKGRIVIPEVLRKYTGFSEIKIKN